MILDLLGTSIETWVLYALILAGLVFLYKKDQMRQRKKGVASAHRFKYLYSTLNIIFLVLAISGASLLVAPLGAFVALPLLLLAAILGPVCAFMFIATNQNPSNLLMFIATIVLYFVPAIFIGILMLSLPYPYP